MVWYGKVRSKVRLDVVRLYTGIRRMIRNFEYLIVFTSALKNDSKFRIFDSFLALLVRLRISVFSNSQFWTFFENYPLTLVNNIDCQL